LCEFCLVILCFILSNTSAIIRLLCACLCSFLYPYFPFLTFTLAPLYTNRRIKKNEDFLSRLLLCMCSYFTTQDWLEQRWNRHSNKQVIFCFTLYLTQWWMSYLYCILIFSVNIFVLISQVFWFYQMTPSMHCYFGHQNNFRPLILTIFEAAGGNQCAAIMTVKNSQIFE